MKTFERMLALASLTAALTLGVTETTAQDQPRRERGERGGDRGGFDPAQLQQRLMERYREQFAVKDDAEWKLIEGRISKVVEARRQVGVGAMGSFFGRGPRPGGDNNAQRPAGGDDQNRRRGGGMFGEPSPEEEALQKAVDAKAPADEIKAKLAKVREARKAKEASLEKAQNELREVLSVSQEATAVLGGLLK